MRLRSTNLLNVVIEDSDQTDLDRFQSDGEIRQTRIERGRTAVRGLAQSRYGLPSRLKVLLKAAEHSVAQAKI